MKKLSSTVLPIFVSSTGAKKLGQPDPESNFVSDENNGVDQSLWSNNILNYNLTIFTAGVLRNVDASFKYKNPSKNHQQKNNFY